MTQYEAPTRSAGVLFNTLMALTMSVPMSLVMLLINGGLDLEAHAFAWRWLQSATTGFLGALPISILAVPQITRLVGQLTHDSR